MNEWLSMVCRFVDKQYPWDIKQMNGDDVPAQKEYNLLW